MLLHGNTGRAAMITVACVVITYCAMVTMWAMRSAAEMATDRAPLDGDLAQRGRRLGAVLRAQLAQDRLDVPAHGLG